MAKLTGDGATLRAEELRPKREAAIKRFEETKAAGGIVYIKRLAEELDVKETTLSGWLQRWKKGKLPRNSHHRTSNPTAEPAGILASLLHMVPAEGSPWPQENRERWLACLRSYFDMVYKDGQ